MNDQHWWFPQAGGGTWKVQVTPDRPDFGLCVNIVSGEEKQWPELKRELYGDGWEEVTKETIEHGRNPP